MRRYSIRERLESLLQRKQRRRPLHVIGRALMTGYTTAGLLANSASRASGGPAAHSLITRGLVRDGHDRWLVVRSVNGERERLLGGLVEKDEPPHDACTRELHEDSVSNVDLAACTASIGWSTYRRGRSLRGVAGRWTVTIPLRSASVDVSCFCPVCLRGRGGNEHAVINDVHCRCKSAWTMLGSARRLAWRVRLGREGCRWELRGH